jgi:nucleotide-binding universal stress UspA family protein
MKKILIPTDFSEEAMNALDFAYGLAKKNGAELILLHVAEYPVSSFNTMGEATVDPMDNVYVVQMMDKMKEKMNALTTDPRYADVNIVGTVEFGSPYSNISSTISEHKVDLVVMGSKGASGLQEVLIGSNTEKVVRFAKCPVITIKGPVDVNSIKSIAFATNLREEESHVVEELKKLQQVLGAELHVVTVNTPNNFMIDRDIKGHMRSFVEKYKLENYTLNIYNDVVEEDGIIYFAEDKGADMIALATHGRTGLMHLLSGSIAEDVVNHSKRPVWTMNIRK